MMLFNLNLPLYIHIFLLGFILIDHPAVALPNFGVTAVREQFSKAFASWSLPFPSSSTSIEKRAQTLSGVNYNPNGTAFLWLPDVEYSGKTFFDTWDFFEGDDPTHGTVHFVNRSFAEDNGLISFNEQDGTVVMKADDFTTLPMGVNRSSVRISSQQLYTTGLFILDLRRAPWGCAIWPAFWTLGVGPTWPQNGEIDILEGVHDNEHNQIAFHTNPGCMYDPNATFTGTIPGDPSEANRTNCDASARQNSGCDVVEWSQASYGPFFEQQGGGVLAMKWDENDISVWSFFRAAVPTDITAGTPNPSTWGLPSARLMNTMCDIPNFFANHTIVFDITFCGDWAGNSYATTNCPGTCLERLMDPANFVNATWSINSLKVYRKELLSGNPQPSSSSYDYDRRVAFRVILPLVAALIFTFY
ncbi:hypothetical protein D9613_003286 [Agrocybe pediades]|uniref:GH16 domain-containing protein n=1 Tax=Agrocybe pediades TaxID=84607 RepID=A0A8H4VP90_9AGAR|nr:hypothetical protein D9613_003286 [Agrocybe pediades]